MAVSIRRRWLARGLAVLTSLSVAYPVAGSDGIIRINATLFDKFAAALQPLSIQRAGWYTFQVPTIFGPVDLPPVYCVATASISNIHLQIAAQSGALVRGDINGTMCGINYSSSVVAPVMISVDASTGGLLVRPIGPININATVSIPGVITITVPLNDVNIAQSLTALTIPLDAIQIQMESPSGPRTLVLVGRNQQLSLHDGFVEIQADAHFR
jgi:hypothetical protein